MVDFRETADGGYDVFVNEDFFGRISPGRGFFTDSNDSGAAKRPAVVSDEDSGRIIRKTQEVIRTQMRAGSSDEPTFASETLR